MQVIHATELCFTSRPPALGSMPDLAYHIGDQNLFRIRDGNDLLPQAMASILGERIVVDAPVVVIDQMDPRVGVIVERDREFVGDVAISTIPFTVLTEVEARPNWPAGTRRMFDEMEWGNIVKIIVQTRTPSWLSRDGTAGQWPAVIVRGNGSSTSPATSREDTATRFFTSTTTTQETCWLGHERVERLRP